MPGVGAGGEGAPDCEKTAVCGPRAVLMEPVQVEHAVPHVEVMVKGLERAEQIRPLQSVLPAAGQVIVPVKVKPLPEPAVYVYGENVAGTVHVPENTTLIVELDAANLILVA